MSKKNNLPAGNKQWKGQVRTTPTFQVANLKSSQLATSDHRSASQTEIKDGCAHELIPAVGLEKPTEVRKDNVNPDTKKEAELKVVKQEPSLNSATVGMVELPSPVALQDVQTVQKNEEVQTPTQKKEEKMKVLTVTTSQEETDLPLKSPDQINKEVVGQVCSPTTPEKKVKFTTIITLQKENHQATDITHPDQTNETVVKEVPAEKKSNVTVVVTLQKENMPEDHLIEFQQDKSPNSHQECEAPPPVPKRSPLKPRLTSSHSSKQQNQEATVQVSRDQSQYTEEGSSLTPDIWDNEGPPPPPPPTGKLSLRISRSRSSRVRTQSKEEDLNKQNGSDIQTLAGDSTGEPTYLAHENQGFEDSDDFDKKPIIVILNEPMDIQSAYKRLSTIFEYEEDLDGVLSPENIVHEEEEEKLDGRNICLTTMDTYPDLKSITGNGQNSLHLKHQRTSADNGSIPENQDQDKPDSLGKPETKRKFKFKFPKNKLAAISQAIRKGTTNTGKKTLEVVVYDEEEEIASHSKQLKETKKQTKESKRFEINSAKQFNFSEGNASDRDIKFSPPSLAKSHSRELCKSAFDSIDSLEESIKQLEISVDSMSAPSSPSSVMSSPPQSPESSFDPTDRAQLKGKARRDRERSPSKRPASQILKGPNPPQSKRAKSQPPPDTGKTSTKKQV